MMAAFKQALEDFYKGPEASKVLEGASPLGALLEFGKQALAKAGAQPPSPVVGRGDRRAARVRAAPAGAPAQAATAPAAAAPALAPPAPGQARVPPKRGRPRHDTTINPTEPKVPKVLNGYKDKPAARALLVQKLSSQVATLKVHSRLIKTGSRPKRYSWSGVLWKQRENSKSSRQPRSLTRRWL